MAGFFMALRTSVQMMTAPWPDLHEMPTSEWAHWPCSVRSCSPPHHCRGLFFFPQMPVRHPSVFCASVHHDHDL